MLKLAGLLCLTALLAYAQSAGVTNVTVSYSATPTFTTNAGITNFDLTLTGNVTSSTFSSAAIGTGSLKICQDATGSRTVAFPANFSGFSAPDSTASKCSRYTWKYDGTNVYATGPCLTDGSAPGAVCGLGTAAGQTTGTFFQVANNLSEGTAATMRTNLGLGTSATVNTGTSGATIGILNVANTWGATQAMTHLTVESVTSSGATGTGSFVFSAAPTLTGHPTIEGVTSTGATGTGNFVFSAAPTLTGHPTIEGVTSTGATGTGNFVFSAAPTITGHPTVEGVTSTGATGTGKFVFDTSPTINGLTMPAASGSAVVTQTVASGTVTINPGAVSSGTCSSAITQTATGAATTDDVMLDFNADPTSTTGYAASGTGVNVYIVKYLTSNTLNVKVCNSTGSSITPGSVTANFRVTR